MRVWLKSDKLSGYNLTASDVQNALLSNNFISAIGQTKGDTLSVTLTANTGLHTKEEFEQLVIRNNGINLVRLRDIADVILGAENYNEEVRFGGQKATFIGVWSLPNANSIDVIKRVRAEIPEIEKQLPSGMKVGIPYDATAYINDALNEVLHTLIETVIIVVLVIYIFIGSFRSVFVPVVAVPLSLVGGVALMYLVGFSLNLLTLLAIVLAVGLVVDDAIVMLENVERYVADGMKPFDAAIKAARELVGPIIAMTITLAAVYAPIGLQGGLTGILFREFAFTLSGAVIVSGFVALTLSPVMSALLIKPNAKPSALKIKVEHAFERLKDLYQRYLKLFLNYQIGVLVFSVMIIFLIVPFYLLSTKELAPKEDQGVVFGIVQNSPNASIEETQRLTELMQLEYQKFPEYQTSFQITTSSGGFSGMLLKPWSERSRTSMELSEIAMGMMAPIPGIRAIMITPDPLPGGSDFPFEVVLTSTASPLQIKEFADELSLEANTSGKFMFADSDLKFDFPQSEIVIDRDKLAALGLTLEEVGRDLGALLGGNYTNRFNIEGRSYKVIPQVKRQERLNPDQIKDIYVRSKSGEMISVATFATIKDTVQARSLNRFQQLNAAKISGAFPPNVSLDQALKVVEDKAAKILPKGYTIDYAGTSRQLRKEQGGMTTTILLSVILIFLVLSAQFESFRDSFVILLGSVPLALAGALAFVFLDATTLNIYSQVGLVTLVGLVAKNGILIVEFANHLKHSGLSKYNAVVQACGTRLRPILMTSVATVVGHFPLVIASGAGSGARNSIGIVLVSGMIIGTFFTLFIVPVFYLLISKEGSKSAQPAEEEVEAEVYSRSSMNQY